MIMIALAKFLVAFCVAACIATKTAGEMDSCSNDGSCAPPRTKVLIRKHRRSVNATALPAATVAKDRDGDAAGTGEVNEAAGPSGQGEIFSVGAPATGETLRQPGSSVVYLVRTWHGSYDSKVKSILRTWGGNLGASLVIVGDKYSVDPPVLGASRCGNDHSVGLACKDGFGLTLAAQALAITRSSWVFVVDDDVYVRTAAVEDALASRNATEPVMLGIPGCGPNLCEDGAGGICGGGGYALSHAALELMVADRPAQSLEAELAETCRGTGGGWDDISVTCAAKRRHIAVDSLDGLHGWRPQDNGELLRWIRSTSPLPLTFHYVDPSKMDYIHGEFGRLNSFVAVDSLNHTMGLEQHRAQVRRYVSTMNARHYSVKLA